MDQRLKAFLVFGTISVIIYVIVLMTSPSEKSFVLTPSGNRDPTKQKLMVVDQDSGEISFVHKSLQGLNQGVTDREAEVSNALRNLLGDNLGNYAGYTKSGNSGVLEKFKLDLIRVIDEKVAVVNKRVTDERTHKLDAIKSLEGSIDKKFGDNDRIYIKAHKNGNDYYLIDEACDNAYGHNDKAAWCNNAYNDMRLVKVDAPR